jgi:hypothetical protein
MRTFDVQGIEIHAPRGRVFEFIRNPHNLPRWAHAFQSADEHSARLKHRRAASMWVFRSPPSQTPARSIGRWSFPTEPLGRALARDRDDAWNVDLQLRAACPPVPLEQVEGALDVQRATLRSELATLKSLLERQ